MHRSAHAATTGQPRPGASHWAAVLTTTSKHIASKQAFDIINIHGPRILPAPTAPRTLQAETPSTGVLGWRMSHPAASRVAHVAIVRGRAPCLPPVRVCIAGSLLARAEGQKGQATVFGCSAPGHLRCRAAAHARWPVVRPRRASRAMTAAVGAALELDRGLAHWPCTIRWHVPGRPVPLGLTLHPSPTCVRALRSIDRVEYEASAVSVTSMGG